MDNENEQGGLQQILTLIELIERETMDVLYEDFISDRMLMEAVAFNLVKLGRKMQKLQPEDKQKLEGMELEKLGELETKMLSLEGEEFDDLVWNTMTEGLPALKKKIEEVM